MNIIRIQDYKDIGLYVDDNGLTCYSTNDNEVLSGIPPSDSSTSSTSSLSSESELSMSSDSSDSSESLNPFEQSSWISGGGRIDVTGGDFSVVSTCQPNVIEGFPSAVNDDNFRNESQWDKIIVLYQHSSGQRLRIVHTLKTGGWIGSSVLSQYANYGVWQKELIILMDKVGDILAIRRDEFGDSEDLVVTADYPSSYSSLSSESSYSSLSSESSESLLVEGVPMQADIFFRTRQVIKPDKRGE